MKFAQQRGKSLIVARLLATLCALTSLSCASRNSFHDATPSGSIDGTAVTPEDLDAVLQADQILSLKDFLNSENAISKYKNKMRLLSGDKISEDKFEWVLDDIRRVALLPDSEKFLQRSWNAEKAVPFELRGTKKHPPVLSPQINFADLIREWKAKVLQRQATLNVSEAVSLAAALRQKHESLAQRARSDDAEAKAQLGRYFSELKSSEQAAAALTTCLHAFFKQGVQLNMARDRKLSAAEFVDALLQSFEARNLSNNMHFPGLTELAKAGLPDAIQKLTFVKCDPFDQVFEFVPTTKALHTFWKGIPCDDCVGGGKNRESVTPERWAIATLPGSRYYFVYLSDAQNAKKYIGYVLLVPIRDPKTGDIYGSVESDAAQLTATMSVDFAEGWILKATVIEAFVRAFDTIKPSEWKGLIKSNAGAANTNGVGGKLTASIAFRQGRSIGGRDVVEHVDGAYAHFLMAAGHSQGSAAIYGGKLITDATTSGAIGRSGASDNRILNIEALKKERIQLFETVDTLEQVLNE